VFRASPALLPYGDEVSGSAWTVTLARLGRTREALADSERIAAERGDRARVQADLARTLSENGQAQEASKAATEALASFGFQRIFA